MGFNLVYDCPICKFKSFENLNALIDALINATTGKFECPVCSDVVQNLDKLVIHLFGHVQKSNRLEQDSKTTRERTDENNNYRINVSIPQIQSSTSCIKHVGVSGVSTPSESSVRILDNEIVSTRIPIVSPPTTSSVEIAALYSCQICTCKFNKPEMLKMHVDLVHGQKMKLETLQSHECHFCAKKFKMKGSLMIHLRMVHTRRPLCQAQSNDILKSTDLAHLNKINCKKQWRCDICEKFFTTKYFLKIHKRLHTGETPYRCEQCNKAFTFQQSYHKHMQYHNAEKPYVCPDCGRAFKELSTLQNHQRIHSGERPFCCDICGKRFRQRVSYLVHSRIHTGEMPYECSECGKTFRYKVSQRTHKCLSKLKKNFQASIMCIQPNNDNIRKTSIPSEQMDTNKTTFLKTSPVSTFTSEHQIAESTKKGYDEKPIQPIQQLNSQITKNMFNKSELINGDLKSIRIHELQQKINSSSYSKGDKIVELGSTLKGFYENSENFHKIQGGDGTSIENCIVKANPSSSTGNIVQLPGQNVTKQLLCSTGLNYHNRSSQSNVSTTLNNSESSVLFKSIDFFSLIASPSAAGDFSKQECYDYSNFIHTTDNSNSNSNCMNMNRTGANNNDSGVSGTSGERLGPYLNNQTDDKRLYEDFKSLDLAENFAETSSQEVTFSTINEASLKQLLSNVPDGC